MHLTVLAYLCLKSFPFHPQSVTSWFRALFSDASTGIQSSRLASDFWMANLTAQRAFGFENIYTDQKTRRYQASPWAQTSKLNVPKASDPTRTSILVIACPPAYPYLQLHVAQLSLTISRSTSDPLSPSLFAVHSYPRSLRYRSIQATVIVQLDIWWNRQVVWYVDLTIVLSKSSISRSGVVGWWAILEMLLKLAACRGPKRCWCPQSRSRTELNGWVSDISCGSKAGI